MGFFTPKLHYATIEIRPLQGLGTDRKNTLKFIKKFFKKYGNYEAVKTTVETARVNGTLTIHISAKQRVINKLNSLSAKLGYNIEAGYDEQPLGKKEQNIVKYWKDQKKTWVIATY